MSANPMSLPCLAFHSVVDRSTVLFSALDNKPIGGEDSGELDDKIICPTTHGFILARDPISLATFLWSPESRRKIHLPPLELEIEDDLLVDCNCLLSDEPTAADCVVLLVRPDEPVIWYCHVGDIQWTKYEYDIGTQALPGRYPREENVVICPIAACRDRFYFNSLATRLGVIDFCPAPVFSSIAIEDTIQESYNEGGWASEFLVESNDELYMVDLFRDHILGPYTDATVRRMDFSKQEWCKVDDLGDRVFLLSRYEFGASCSGDEAAGLRRNCVYLVDHRRQNALHVFNVKDGSIQSRKLDDAPVSDKAFWVLPSGL